ncbi:hypothetical protein Desti_4543 [Desulfomonile tiedjei DSM 6799]|uniref:Uncharacterized protein n=1 Tax=Desulfomonile tiedjei (strain ATCC 49306 / DSM 6799 / DCB-1) TaxID=706587 RepID=I4CC80_DESTA|nr:hypothetical protein Desti_4543 [Desulfomonile tiedjei DSM 6799]
MYFMTRIERKRDVQCALFPGLRLSLSGDIHSVTRGRGFYSPIGATQL